MRFLKITLSFLVVLSFLSCSGKKQEAQKKSAKIKKHPIMGLWKVTEMKMGEQNIPFEKFGNFTMEFKNDGSYETRKNDKSKMGRWQVKNNQLIMQHQDQFKSEKVDFKLELNQLTLTQKTMKITLSRQ